MKLIIFLCFAIISLSAGKPIPIDLDIPYDEAPPDTGLYTCSKPHWQGDCIWGIPGSVLRSDGDRVCMTLISPDSWFISFGPDKAIACSVFTENNCKGHQMDISYPGWDYLPAAGFAGGKCGFRTYRCLLKAVVIVGNDTVTDG
jgi:hypothetical protein